MNTQFPSLFRFPLLAGVILAILSSCGGGGGGGGGGTPVMPVGNLKVTTLQVISNLVATAHEMELATGISATAEIGDVPVSYFLLNKEDADNGVEDMRQFFVSTSLFGTVTTGEAKYSSVVRLPKNVDPPGDYYLIAQVDPENVIPETDEEDNLPTQFSVVVTIDGTKANSTDVVIEDASLDTDAVILYPPPLKFHVIDIGRPDVENHDFGVNLTITATGAKDVEVDLSATITYLGNSIPMPLDIWNSDFASYQDMLPTTITPGIPNNVHLDVYVPTDRGVPSSSGGLGLGTVRNLIHRHLNLKPERADRFQVKIVAELGNGQRVEFELGSTRFDPGSTILSKSGLPSRNDNTIELDFVIALPPIPPLDRINWDSSYAKYWGGETFGVGVDFRGSATLDNNGFTAEGKADVPIMILGSGFELLEFNAFAHVSPQDHRSQFNLDVRVLGRTVYSQSSSNPTFSWSKDWTIPKTKRINGTLWVGPLPVGLTAGITGTLGFHISTELDPASGVKFSAVPYADLTAFAEASVNLLVVRAGVRGSLTLLNDTFTADAEILLTSPLTATSTSLEATASLQTVNDLRGPHGRIWLFVDREVLEWCKAFGIPYPCGFRTVTDELTLMNFSSFRKVDLLFKDMKAAVVPLY